MPQALLTDLYQLTMAAGYYEAGKAKERATFELFARKLPPNRNFTVACGLEQVVEYLLNFRFTSEELDYLRSLPQFSRVHPEFFDMLGGLRFTGDLFAVREGTPLFPGEPFLTVRGPIIEAQIAETFLLATIGFQTLVASKAARVVKAAQGRRVVEFGSRRAHSPEAGVYGARAAFIGGCAGTSNLETGRRWGIPVFGTSAHSWVLSFPRECDAFLQLQKLLGLSTVYLIDSYDTLQGARLAASLGKPLWGVRLDSGNLIDLAPKVRQILDDAGLNETNIMASGDLNEHRIQDIVSAGAPIDAFGVGTELATSFDAPALGVVYKLVELESPDGKRRFTAKFSEDKHTVPGAKQIFRFSDHDKLGRTTECPSCPPGSPPSVALQRPVILQGRLIQPLPTVYEAREWATESIAKLPESCRSLLPADPPYRVELTAELESLAEKVQEGAAR